MLWNRYFCLFVKASIPVTDFFLGMVSPWSLSSQFGVCSFSWGFFFCWNLRIWQQNLHPRAASPPCWDPALPQNHFWESCTNPAPSHWEGDTKNKPQILPLSTIPSFHISNSFISGLQAVGLSWKSDFWFCKAVFPPVFFFLIFFLPPLNQGGIGISVEHYCPNLGQEGKFAAQGVINDSTFTSKTALSTKSPG